jgi:hypothetical protein
MVYSYKKRDRRHIDKKKVARYILDSNKRGYTYITLPAHDMQSTSLACPPLPSEKKAIVLLLRLRSSLAKDRHQGYLNASETSGDGNPPHHSKINSRANASIALQSSRTRRLFVI